MTSKTANRICFAIAFVGLQIIGWHHILFG